ncbi:TPA: RHS repeat domain-containing protein, partial [Elizabethkingia anophelis]
NGVLQFVPTSEGYYDVVKNKYIYNYTDHLGNVRLSYTKGASGGAEIIEENNYYPFGLKHQGYNSTSLANSAYQYKYQGQELQENGWYNFKWRNYIPELGRFFNVDPLASKYSYNSPYAFQENKLGMGVELEGLELLKNNTGFFAINGNAMKVKRAPLSQMDRNGRPLFTAGDIGLSTRGYNPDGARIITGTTGLKQDSYKYNGPVASSAQLQDNIDMPSNSDRQRPTTTILGKEMWNLKQRSVDNAVTVLDGVKEVTGLIGLAINIPNVINSTNNYVKAVNDIATIKSQATTMDQAIQLVDGSEINMTQQVRNDVINYIFDGSLPNPNAGLMPNSLIIQHGVEIMKSNGIQIQSIDEQLNKNKKLPQ